MSKDQQRSELSMKNRYYISKLRYLELKNFCKQYNEWKTALKEISLTKAHTEISTSGPVSDQTHQLAAKRLKYEENIHLIEETALLADPSIAHWIIKGVTESYSYEYLHLQLGLPAGREMYYDRYRRFFWLLDKKR